MMSLGFWFLGFFPLSSCKKQHSRGCPCCEAEQGLKASWPCAREDRHGEQRAGRETLGLWPWRAQPALRRVTALGAR